MNAIARFLNCFQSKSPEEKKNLLDHEENENYNYPTMHPGIELTKINQAVFKSADNLFVRLISHCFPSFQKRFIPAPYSDDSTKMINNFYEKCVNEHSIAQCALPEFMNQVICVTDGIQKHLQALKMLDKDQSKNQLTKCSTFLNEIQEHARNSFKEGALFSAEDWFIKHSPPHTRQLSLNNITKDKIILIMNNLGDVKEKIEKLELIGDDSDEYKQSILKPIEELIKLARLFFESTTGICAQNPKDIPFAKVCDQNLQLLNAVEDTIIKNSMPCKYITVGNNNEIKLVAKNQPISKEEEILPDAAKMLEDVNTFKKMYTSYKNHSEQLLLKSQKVFKELEDCDTHHELDCLEHINNLNDLCTFGDCCDGVDHLIGEERQKALEQLNAIQEKISDIVKDENKSKDEKVSELRTLLSNLEGYEIVKQKRLEVRLQELKNNIRQLKDANGKVDQPTKEKFIKCYKEFLQEFDALCNPMIEYDNKYRKARHDKSVSIETQYKSNKGKKDSDNLFSKEESMYKDMCKKMFEQNDKRSNSGIQDICKSCADNFKIMCDLLQVQESN